MKELSELLEGIEVEDDEFIPKSKIRTKIKELEEEYNNCKRGDDTFKKAKLLYQIAILKELLGDDE